MSDDIEVRKRPLLVTIVGILDLLVAIVFIIAGLGAILMGDSTTVTSMISDPELANAAAQLSKPAGIVLLILGIIELIIGVGLLKGWRVMWYLGVIIYILTALVMAAGLVLAFNFAGVIALIICVIIIYYLYRPNVKEFFRI